MAVPPTHCLLYRRRRRPPPTECDGLAAYRRLPLAVANCPKRNRRCSASCRSATGLTVPIVPRGAGTGLSGGAMPIPSRRGGVAGALPEDRRSRLVCADRDGAAGVRNLLDFEAAAVWAVRRARSCRRRSPARSAATSPRTPAACTALKYGLTRCTTCCARARDDGRRNRRPRFTLRRTRLVLDLLAVLIGRRGHVR